MIFENCSLSRQISQIFATKSIDIKLGSPSHAIFSLSKFYAIQKNVSPFTCGKLCAFPSHIIECHADNKAVEY